jgi:DNA-binding transcriptional ArsR family regulator
VSSLVDTRNNAPNDAADVVFKALADPTRRALLDALFAVDGQSVQALCSRFPAMTRFGVMKHIAVLEAANLVVARRHGRQKLHFLNPVPIAEMADRWISKYASPFARALVDLRAELEADLEAN